MSGSPTAPLAQRERGDIDVQNAVRAHPAGERRRHRRPDHVRVGRSRPVGGTQRVALTLTRTVVLREAGHVPMCDVTEEITQLVLEDALAEERGQGARTALIAGDGELLRAVFAVEHGE